MKANVREIKGFKVMDIKASSGENEDINDLKEQIEQMIETGDRDIFCDEFNKIAEWFGPFSEQAMQESTYLIDKLIERF